MWRQGTKGPLIGTFAAKYVCLADGNENVIPGMVATLRRALQRATVDDDGARIPRAPLLDPRENTKIVCHRFKNASVEPTLSKLCEQSVVVGSHAAEIPIVLPFG